MRCVVGEMVWFVPYARGVSRSLAIERVSRKWVTLEGAFRFSPKDARGHFPSQWMVYRGTVPCGTVFESPEDHEAAEKKQIAWRKLVFEVNRQYLAPKWISGSEIAFVHELINALTQDHVPSDFTGRPVIEGSK